MSDVPPLDPAALSEHATAPSLRRPAVWMRALPSEGYVDFVLAYGEWIRLFSANGLLIRRRLALMRPSVALMRVRMSSRQGSVCLRLAGYKWGFLVAMDTSAT